MHEGGSHVPFILHWPDGIPHAGRFDGLVSSLDIAATAVAVAGGDATEPMLEGVNLAPYVAGTLKGSPHEALFWRIRDGVAWCVRTPNGKYLKENWGDGLVALYDMTDDPYESTNLLGTAPEKQAALARLWNSWNADNTANVLLQAGEYQKKRLQMYQQLNESLKEKAVKTPPVDIE